MPTSDAREKYVIKFIGSTGRPENVLRRNGNVASLVGLSEAQRYAKRCAKLQPTYAFFIVKEYV